MRGYLIDPVARTVTEIEHDENLVPILEYDTFEILARLAGVGIRDALIVNGDRTVGTSFIFKGSPTPIVGKALYSGHTIDGEMCDPKLPIDRVKRLLTFESS